MRDGLSVGLTLMDELFTRDELTTYHRGHAALANLCLRFGRTAEPRTTYERARILTQQSRSDVCSNAG